MHVQSCRILVASWPAMIDRPSSSSAGTDQQTVRLSSVFRSNSYKSRRQYRQWLRREPGQQGARPGPAWTGVQVALAPSPTRRQFPNQSFRRLAIVSRETTATHVQAINVELCQPRRVAARVLPYTVTHRSLQMNAFLSCTNNRTHYDPLPRYNQSTATVFHGVMLWVCLFVWPESIPIT